MTLGVQVMSHQQALSQCDNYLRAMPGVAVVPTYDTAGSAKMIAEKGMTGSAAIASELAAETYGLEILAKNIEDDDVNFTRFLLLARSPVGVHIPPPMPTKTSVVSTLAVRIKPSLFPKPQCNVMRYIQRAC